MRQAAVGDRAGRRLRQFEGFALEDRSRSRSPVAASSSTTGASAGDGGLVPLPAIDRRDEVARVVRAEFLQERGEQLRRRADVVGRAARGAQAEQPDAERAPLVAQQVAPAAGAAVLAVAGRA